MKPDRFFPLIPGSVLAVFIIGMAVAFAAPGLDPSMGKFGQHASPRTVVSAQGKAVYDDQGCAFCHTQQVRAVSNDLGLGSVTDANRVVRDDPSELGLARIGPDLACFGDRQKDVASVAEFLADPSSQKSFTRMPAYGFLEEEELNDLAAYLVSLTCGGSE